MFPGMDGRRKEHLYGGIGVSHDDLIDIPSVPALSDAVIAHLPPVFLGEHIHIMEHIIVGIVVHGLYHRVRHFHLRGGGAACRYQGGNRHASQTQTSGGGIVCRVQAYAAVRGTGGQTDAGSLLDPGAS